MTTDELNQLREEADACYQLQQQAEHAFDVLDAKLTALGLDESELMGIWKS